MEEALAKYLVEEKPDLIGMATATAMRLRVDSTALLADNVESALIDQRGVAEVLALLLIQNVDWQLVRDRAVELLKDE